MPKGTIKSYDKNCGMGFISRLTDVDVRFYAQSIAEIDRIGLFQGDSVRFDMDHIKHLNIAVNIKKFKG